MPDRIDDNWWQDFFGSPDSLSLSCFPADRETATEIRGLQRILKLTPADRIADVCCGYGRHLARLTRRGLNVVGLDFSEMMLRHARTQLGEEQLTAPLIRGDAAALPFADQSIDVVLNLFNSFGYFTAEGQNLQVLREAARVLRPGGRFLLDTRNRQFQILFAPHCQPVTTPQGRELVLRCRYDREASRLDSWWTEPEDREAVVHEASIRLYGLDELRDLVDQVGFDELGVYGTYRGERFEGFHRQLLYVGRKR